MKILTKTTLVLTFCLLATNLLANDVNDRARFVDQISLENCTSVPSEIFINPDSIEFDLANSFSLTWVGLQTLENDAGLTQLEQWGFDNIKIIENTSWKVRAMILDYNDSVFLTFRHSDSNLNWAFNADLGLWNFEHSFALGEKIHHGFGITLGKVWDEIVSEINIRSHNGKRVHVFGHSLGGAFALLAAPGLVEEGIDVAQVYTSGTPKVGSESWASRAQLVMANIPIYRLTNANDLISRIPVGETSLDEFSRLFSFIPSFFKGFLDNIRYEMPFGLLGQHITMTDEFTLSFADEVTNDLEEQSYWQSIAEQFELIDQNANNLIKNAQEKAKVINNNLNAHLIRKENGYACKMVAMLKSGL